MIVKYLFTDRSFAFAVAILTNWHPNLNEPRKPNFSFCTLSPFTHIGVFLKTEIFLLLSFPSTRQRRFRALETPLFENAVPEWIFFKKKRAYFFRVNDRKRRFSIRWRHTSYNACPVKDAIVFLSSFSVFKWKGENDSNTLRVDADFFSKIETNLGFQKYPGTCGRDHCVRQLAFSEFPKLSLSKRG